MTYERQPLRAYFFNNMYLQGIQAGIQAQHCTSELFLKYAGMETKSSDMLQEWAVIDKTTIIINGGANADLFDFMEWLRHVSHNEPSFNLPYAYFNEEGVNNATTSVGIIVPESIYKMDLQKYQNSNIKFDILSHNLTPSWKIQLAERIQKCRLMN